MSRGYIAVVREPGPAWNPDLPMREQDGWDEHAAFMDALAEAGFIVLGGPLGDERGHALHIVDAADLREAKRRFAEDPWSDHMLKIARIEPWTVLLEAPG
jgi:uncharacterized protein YciI